jgi:histidinol dehydrogenase
MMQLFTLPDRKDWKKLTERTALNSEKVEQAVQNILNAVKERGDEALKEFTQQFDKVQINDFLVSESSIQQAASLLPQDLKQAIQNAYQNITTFHLAQQEKNKIIVETQNGVKCWRKSVAIQKVGLYIPGGTAPLFSTVLMLGVPAQIAGCSEVILCTPCNQQGEIHPAILFAAKLVGIKKIFSVGGAQAIAAMTFGTETIPQVYKIFGPGNQYVTAAKQLATRYGVAIDMPAGPSEVLVYADETANPAFVAADLLSQAEHGADSQSILVTHSQAIAEQVLTELHQQLKTLPRREIAQKALENSRIILLQPQNAIDFINAYAAEHLILSVKNAHEIAEKITDAGSVFIGNYSPESVGDYASGTNHTLPTNGYARAYSGVSLDSFVKKITFQELSKEGLQGIARTVTTMAEAELLEAHKLAVIVRLENI